MSNLKNDAEAVVCFNCFFYDHPENNNAHGFCRRHAPAARAAKDAAILIGVWPEVRRSDWCGEFRHDADFTRVPPEPITDES